MERQEALPHIVERGCVEGWVAVLPSGQGVWLGRVTDLQSLTLDANDRSMDEFDPFDGGDDWKNSEGQPEG